MYVYQITNNINGKIYIGITNNYKRRWANECCKSGRNQVIGKAIQKYGKENFTFEILEEGLTIEEASQKEIELIQLKNSRVPNGYNVALGGMNKIGDNARKVGAENGKAVLTTEEAQYIKDHRNIPMYALYQEFKEKICYSAFKDCYNNKTYFNLIPKVEPYPYNLEFSLQFSSNNLLDYDDVASLRKRYANGEYWRKVYEEYKDVYKNDWDFWNVYNGNIYKLVMPEVFTPELKHLHSSYTKQGEKNGRSKLTEQDVIKIRQLHNNKISNSEIYKMFPQVSKTSIRNVIDRKTWTYL